jgi:DNA-binding NarL/FixJ family response regulator
VIAQRSATAITVMVVDDTTMIRVMLRRALERAGGFDVVAEAADGLEAIRLAEAQQPDAITLDLSMPNLDGLQALPRLKAASPRSAIVVFSGFGASAMASEALASGADAYVDKSRPASDVVTALRQLTSPVAASRTAPTTDTGRTTAESSPAHGPSEIL